MNIFASHCVKMLTSEKKIAGQVVQKCRQMGIKCKCIISGYIKLIVQSTARCVKFTLLTIYISIITYDYILSLPFKPDRLGIKLTRA